MIKREPHFQGRLDVFCSIYAVINALVLTHDLPSDKARKILHESILAMSRDQLHFKKQLDQAVEYHDLVDSILNRETLRRNLLVRTPYGHDLEAPKDHVWATLGRWLSKPRRAAVLRFIRPLGLPGGLEIRHWTTARAVTATPDDERIDLYDCSRETTAIHEICKSHCLTSQVDLQPGYVYVDPSSIRLLAADI